MIKTCKDVYVITESQMGVWKMYNSGSYPDDVPQLPGRTFLMLPLSQDEHLTSITLGGKTLEPRMGFIPGSSQSPDYEWNQSGSTYSGTVLLEGKDTGGYANWTINSLIQMLTDEFHSGNASASTVINQLQQLVVASEARYKGNGMDVLDSDYCSSDYSGWWMVWQFYPGCPPNCSWAEFGIDDPTLKFNISEQYKTVIMASTVNKSSL